MLIMALVISKKHKYIFFHLPKNAGVSLSRALIAEEKLLQIKRYFSYLCRISLKKKDNFYFSIKDKELIFFNSHITCYNFYDIFNKFFFNNYEKIAVVRNPWDRMVSRYFYSKKVNLKFKDFTFEEFVNFDIKNNMHILNQYRFCTKDRTNFCIDKVIKFENLNSDFNEISSRIFGKKNLLKHSNQTDHEEYRQYYSTELKDKIYNNFKEDLNFFDYEF